MTTPKMHREQNYTGLDRHATYIRGQKIFRLPGLTHVLPKELCYLKFGLSILMWNGYKKADTPAVV